MGLILYSRSEVELVVMSGGLLIAVKENASFKWKQIKNDYLLSIKIDKEDVNLDNKLVLSCVCISPSHSR